MPRTLEQAVSEARRKTGLDIRIGFLGDGSGDPRDSRTPGNLWVRYQTSDGFTQAFSLPVDPNANLLIREGLDVEIGFRNGVECILRASVEGALENSISPYQFNPLDEVSNALKSQEYFMPFYFCRFVDSDPDDPQPLTISVAPTMLRVGGLLQEGGRAKIAVDGLVPAAGLQCWAVVFWNTTDQILTAYASTEVDIEAIDVIAALQECYDQAGDDERSICGVYLADDQAALDDDKNHWIDLREVINVPSTGGGSAPTDATYITQTPDATLTNEQALSSLATGLLRSTTGTGVLSIATPGTHYTTPTGLESLSNKLIATSTLTTPTIASFANANHNHEDSAGGGTLDAAAIAAGTLPLARGGTGQSAASNTALFNAIDPLTTKGDIVVHDGTDSTRLAVGANGTHLVADSGQTTGLKWQSAYPFAIIEEQQPSGTAGGSSTATTWSTRVLNWEVEDADSIVSLSLNRFTPIAGVYRIEVWSPHLGNSTNNGAARIRLYNHSTSAEVFRSTNYNLFANTAILVPLVYQFTTNGAHEYRIDYYVTQARTTAGLGGAISEASEVERYTRVFLQKIG